MCVRVAASPLGNRHDRRGGNFRCARPHPQRARSSRFCGPPAAREFPPTTPACPIRLWVCAKTVFQLLGQQQNDTSGIFLPGESVAHRRLSGKAGVRVFHFAHQSALRFCRATHPHRRQLRIPHGCAKCRTASRPSANQRPGCVGRSVSPASEGDRRRGCGGCC
jgi:hypothetical protein